MNKMLWNLKTKFFKLFRSSFPFGIILNKENRNLVSLLEKVEISGKTALDLGVGTGNVIQFLIEARNVFGIDFTNSMLQETRKNFPSVELILADASIVPMKSESFDLITSVGLIEYLNDAIPFFEESCRLLKDEGYLVLTFSPANIWTKLRSLTGHSVYSRKLKQIVSVANLNNFRIVDYQQSMMQQQILMQKVI